MMDKKAAESYRKECKKTSEKTCDSCGCAQRRHGRGYCSENIDIKEPYGVCFGTNHYKVNRSSYVNQPKDYNDCVTGKCEGWNSFLSVLTKARKLKVKVRKNAKNS